MGRSSSSCLKIIACGSDAADNDDVDSPEAKVSSAKRGWSFGKRSGRHRVLGNNVSSETPTSAGKETPQGANSDFQSPIKSTSADEKSQLPKPVEKNTDTVSAMEHDDESKASAVVLTSENDSNETYAESKICLPLIAAENPSNPTTAESKAVDTAVVSESDSNATLAEPKMVNAVVFTETDGSRESAELKINESMIAPENAGDPGVISNEPAVIIIQSAIRGFLARRRFVKIKSAIKLQAAIRGHLVRKNAVETLHCIRAIVKVQALVRARSSKFLDQKSKPNDTQFSTVKMLKNGFARKLLETTPKPKSVKIRCNPLRPNSAWGWLERWMSVSTSEVAQRSEPGLEQEDDNQVEKTAVQADAEDSSIVRFYSVNSKFVTDEIPRELETEENNAVHDVSATDTPSSYPQSKEEDDTPVLESAMQTDAEDSSMIRFYSVKSKFITDEAAESLENEENHIVDDVNAVDLQSCCPLTEEKSQEIISQEIELIQDEMAPDTLDALANEISRSQADPISHADRPSSESEEPKLCMKRSASEELEGEGKKVMYVSRKASNPAFIAAQSKFEELSSAANSDSAVSSPFQDAGVKSHDDTTSSVEETAKKTDEPCSVEISAPDSKIIAVSECGTELSISSTLDSPDRSDVGNTEAEQEKKFSEEMSCDATNREGSDGETYGISGHTETDLPSGSVQLEEIHRNNGVSVTRDDTEISPEPEQKLEMSSSDLQTIIDAASTVIPDSSSMEQKHEQNGHDVQLGNDSGTEHQARKSSPEASPKTHVTVSESQGTPSSQVSVKGKRNKTDKTGSNVKRSLSSGKRSPLKPNLDSGVRSTEHLPKDHKSGKRRNSFGSTKSDNADQEPRDSSSHNPLPSYMQATESARAKAHSPRSSPDVHDKEVPVKKRHSLPGASGRQGSPHIRSASQVAQGAKTNGSGERKWQR